MIIKVTYNKESGDIELINDIKSILITKNEVIDTSNQLSFEIAVDTSQYELDERNDEDNLIESIV